MNDREFEKTVITYKDQLYNYLFWMTGNRTEAEDVLQETFLRYYKYGDPVENPKAWLFKVARNVYLKRQRKRSREVSLELVGADPVMPGMQIALEREELIRKVREGLRKLKDHHREVIILRYMEGLSYEEIAAVLGESVGTIKSRLNRAKEKLKEKLILYMGVEK
ncbi:MAG: RNA polymerase sigma factor [Candidatus Hydrothermae bacterium]|nr:RNA polymerase sigma factor [Candidatus Hydrothermae bacterium]